jgi:catechol 2,3-dioxygenase-like lactoylglutathione lyase family enzyme
MTPQLDAFGIVVSDMARSLAFYGKLGLRFPEGVENEGHVEAEPSGGVRYMLDTEDVIRSFDSEWQRPTGGHAAGGSFRCDSPEEVDRVYRELLDAGGSARQGPVGCLLGSALRAGQGPRRHRGRPVCTAA